MRVLRARGVASCCGLDQVCGSSVAKRSCKTRARQTVYRPWNSFILSCVEVTPGSLLSDALCWRKSSGSRSPQVDCPKTNLHVSVLLDPIVTRLCKRWTREFWESKGVAAPSAETKRPCSRLSSEPGFSHSSGCVNHGFCETTILLC